MNVTHHRVTASEAICLAGAPDIPVRVVVTVLHCFAGLSRDTRSAVYMGWTAPLAIVCLAISINFVVADGLLGQRSDPGYQSQTI